MARRGTPRRRKRTREDVQKQKEAGGRAAAASRAVRKDRRDRERKIRERVKELIRRLGTREAAALAVGVPVSTIKDWAAGRRVLRLDVALDIARSSGVTLDYLAGDERSTPRADGAAAADIHQQVHEYLVERLYRLGVGPSREMIEDAMPPGDPLEDAVTRCRAFVDRELRVRKLETRTRQAEAKWRAALRLMTPKQRIQMELAAPVLDALEGDGDSE